jgi:hypothetical protein
MRFLFEDFGMRASEGVSSLAAPKTKDVCAPQKGLIHSNTGVL